MSIRDEFGRDEFGDVSNRHCLPAASCHCPIGDLNRNGRARCPAGTAAFRRTVKRRRTDANAG